MTCIRCDSRIFRDADGEHYCIACGARPLGYSQMAYTSQADPIDVHCKAKLPAVSVFDITGGDDVQQVNPDYWSLARRDAVIANRRTYGPWNPLRSRNR